MTGLVLSRRTPAARFFVVAEVDEEYYGPAWLANLADEQVATNGEARFVKVAYVPPAERVVGDVTATLSGRTWSDDAAWALGSAA